MEETVKMEEKNGMKIRKIYKPQIVEQKTKQSLRVAAYCRVSTKSNEQYTSYETQVAVYTKRIKDEPGWILAGIYADRGLSGTQADRRPQFLQMVKDCENGEIDVIICKSVSRFISGIFAALECALSLKKRISIQTASIQKCC